MKLAQTQSKVPASVTRRVMVIVCAVLTLPGDLPLSANGQQPAATGANQSSPQSNQPEVTLSSQQLDSLVAPLALYPDPLLTQALVASTYPLEIVQLQQWLQQNKGLKDKALADAVEKQNWDPSIQAMAAFPDVVKQLAENIKWTTDLGNAFLAQQNDVMDAVQRMRGKAVEKGALKSTEQQTVETKVVENKSVVVIQPAKTEVVYVPSYDPVAVWGTPYYPYPAVAYPAYPVGGALLGFGIGVAFGAAWSGGWGWNYGWGGNNVYVNRNNTFVNNYNRANAGNRYGGANNTWRHNPQHRGGAPYSNRATAARYGGGTARGNNVGARQAGARQGQGQLGTRQGQGQLGTRQGQGQLGSRQGGNGNGNLGGQGINRGAGGGGGDRVGNRQVSNGTAGSRNSSALSGGSSGQAAGANRSRGASSMGGGGGFRGGGGRGGGRRR